MNNTPKFIKLHCVGVEGMVNIQRIHRIVPYADEMAHVYVDNRESPLCIDESYEEIKKKLEKITWIV